MSKESPGVLIRLRGVRQNNLKNFDLDLPTGQLLVVTGLSGSGKSSLAFDTLYAEGQRRYIETFSPYARQFFDRMDKPQVDSIQGIPPAIAIEQRNAVKSTRSTVGTMTEICDYMKVLWAHLAQLFCRQCEQAVRKDPPQRVWENLRDLAAHGSIPGEALISFELALSEKLSVAESLALITKQGYQRLLIPREGKPPETLRVEEAAGQLGPETRTLCVLQDRVKIESASRTRTIEACEQAYHFGKGKLTVSFLDGTPARKYSNRLHCAKCDLEYREPGPALFSFNHPAGACPACRGFGRTITIDYDLAIPDRSLSLAEGVVKPWQTGQSAECQKDLMKFCRLRKAPVDVPFARLPPEWQRWVIEGDPGYGQDKQHEWPHAWYGLKGYFRWLESKAYKMHVRVLLSRYRAYRPCPDCHGRRFQPEALLFRLAGADEKPVTLSDFYQLPVQDALRFIRAVRERHAPSNRSDPLKLVLDEICARLGYLHEVGLGYLTLDRPTRSLSGGETERVNLTTCLGSRLVNTLFVLDEPSVGLHSKDTQRLIGILQRLRDAGNTVLVVEHEASVMRAADQIIDIGPGHGEAGGQLVFQGAYSEILASARSVTGAYLRGEKRVEVSRSRPVRNAATLPGRGKEACPFLTLTHAQRHNLKDLTVEIPLGRLVCITGVSGSGKTTLIREVLLPLLESKLRFQALPWSGAQDEPDEGAEGAQTDCGTAGNAEISGWQHLGQVVLVDQSLLGKTPRSNPAVYIGAFDHIREVFAQSESAKRHGLNASAFSFNSSQGQCEQCRGAGFEKIEMQFLSDVYIRCPACQGRRYREHILQVTLPGPTQKPQEPKGNSLGARHVRERKKSLFRKQRWSIADLLEATVDEAVDLLGAMPNSRPAQRAAAQLTLLQEAGLGYLRLGQPINTLSGGESQRLKLVSHLAGFNAAESSQDKPALFLFDEPTTGLHFDDVRVLLQVFQRLVDQGHSVVVVEHNLDLIKCADWVIDLGPEAGDGGGLLVAAGTPSDIARVGASYTGQSLREMGI